MKRVTLIPGDGTGPELVEAARRVIDASGVSLCWEQFEAGADEFMRTGNAFPDATLSSLLRNRVALRGPITTPLGHGFRSVNLSLRQSLDLFACIRPCKSYDGVPSPYSNVDIVIVRDNMEDLYTGFEFEAGRPETHEVRSAVAAGGFDIRRDAGISIKAISTYGANRIVRAAFEYARAHDRKTVTAAHKANLLKHTDGLFLAVAREVAEEYPDVEFNHLLIDNLCYQLVRNPMAYDVIVAPNMYGDILSDLCAGLVGSLGLAGGMNIGPDAAIFEAAHGSAPKYAGRNMVNPAALILSGAYMLEHIGESGAARMVERAVATVIREGSHVTYDLKVRRDDPSAVGTAEFADAVIAALRLE